MERHLATKPMNEYSFSKNQHYQLPSSWAYLCSLHFGLLPLSSFFSIFPFPSALTATACLAAFCLAACLTDCSGMLFGCGVNSLPGLNLTVNPGAICLVSPVLGLRPIPRLRGRTVNTPKPRSSIRSPL